MAGVGCGDFVCVLIEIAVEDSGGGGLATDDGGVDAFAGEWVDEAGSVSDKQNPTGRDVGVASHAELLSGDVGEGGNAEFLAGVVKEEGAGDLLEVLRSHP